MKKLSALLRKLKLRISRKSKHRSPTCINCKHCRMLRNIHTGQPYIVRCNATSKAVFVQLKDAQAENNQCVCHEFK